MEISNRTLGIASASIILFGISMRVQSGSANEPAQSTASLGNMQPKSIPDSDFATVSKYQTIPQTPVDTKLGGTPNQDLINLNQAGAIVPGVTRVQDDSRPIVVVPPTPNGTNSDQQNADDSMQGYNGSGSGMYIAPTGNPVLDTTVSSFDADDQAGFTMMWSTMTADQRQQFMARLQQNR
jgi:hypothetical protein